MCPYQFYKEDETYYPKLYCKANGKTCPHSKRCGKEERYISISGAEKCHIMEEQKRKDIPKDTYYVRTYKQRPNGTYSLYVDIDGNGTIEKINTDFTDFDQYYVYLDKVNGVYIPSLTPIKKKASNGRKKKS